MFSESSLCDSLLMETLPEVLGGHGGFNDLGLIGSCSCFLRKNTSGRKASGGLRRPVIHTNEMLSLRGKQQKSSSFGMFQHMF